MAPAPTWDAARGVFVGDKAASNVAVPDPLWIFGYGSLVWRPEAGWEAYESAEGVVEGWGRFFAQRSMDHRGTPDAPGLVCTLLPDEALLDLGAKTADQPPSRTRGTLYKVPKGDAKKVLDDLDFREKGGYSRALATCTVGDTTVEALIYSATTENPNFAPQFASDSEAALDGAAAVIATAVGPSGRNDEYVLKLCDAITDDPYLARLAEKVRAKRPADAAP